MSRLKSKLAKDALGDVMDQVQEIKGVKVLAARLADVDMNGLRDLGDQLKEKLGEGVVVLASVKDGKVNLMATATDGAMKAGRSCRQPHQRQLRPSLAAAAADVRTWLRPAERTRQVMDEALERQLK